MNQYRSCSCKREYPKVRSSFMKTEEIEEERQRSGWNPYEGEEEVQELEGYLQMTPFFSQPDYAQILDEQKEEERDRRSIQSMYPETAKIIMPFVEETCDKMEYEGSMMFDEYPDRVTLWRMQEEIYTQVQDQFPQQEIPEEDVDVLSMQYTGNRRRAPGKNWLRDIIDVVLLDEIHHRRCRHRRCRQNCCAGFGK